MRNILFTLVFGVSATVACSSSSTTPTPASDGGPSASDGGADSAADAGSICGKPGDTGNSKGIGKYCNVLIDCVGNKEATLCSTLGDPTAHFCTKTCPKGDNAPCGENTECTCNSQDQCGCTPSSCL